MISRNVIRNKVQGADSDQEFVESMLALASNAIVAQSK